MPLPVAAILIFKSTIFLTFDKNIFKSKSKFFCQYFPQQKPCFLRPLRTLGDSSKFLRPSRKIESNATQFLRWPSSTTTMAAIFKQRPSNDIGRVCRRSFDIKFCEIALQTCPLNKRPHRDHSVVLWHHKPSPRMVRPCEAWDTMAQQSLTAVKVPRSCLHWSLAWNRQYLRQILRDSQVTRRYQCFGLVWLPQDQSCRHFTVGMSPETRHKSAGPGNVITAPDAHKSHKIHGAWKTAEPRQPSKDHLPCRCSGGCSTQWWSLLQCLWYHVLLLPSSGSISSNLAVLLVSTHNAVTSLAHELMNVEPCSHHTGLQMESELVILECVSDELINTTLCVVNIASCLTQWAMDQDDLNRHIQWTLTVRIYWRVSYIVLRKEESTLWCQFVNGCNAL